MKTTHGEPKENIPKKNFLQWALLFAFVIALPAPGYPQDAQRPAGSQSLPRSLQVIDQVALEQLKRMSAALSRAQAFSYKSRNTVEHLAKNGQFVTLLGNSEVTLQRPNKLRVQVKGEVPNFDFFYDGMNVAAFASQDRIYAIMPAPDTIDEMLKVTEEKTGIHFPTMDVMVSDPYTALTNGLISAIVVGTATVNDVMCDHLAFRTPRVNWEIWIQSQDPALPQHLAVTYVKEPNLPRVLVDFYDWNLEPKLEADTFAFTPPPSARRGEFGSVIQQRALQQNNGGR